MPAAADAALVSFQALSGPRQNPRMAAKKVDLKARLGKKTVSSGSSIPPPVGIPKPAGIPVPAAFGASPSAPARPRVDASDPYAAIAADQAPARAEPAAIKVEMSEEVVAAQRKGRAKIAVLAVATAIVGGLVGYAVGSGVERGKGAEKAIAGAEDLAKEIDDTNAKIEELAEVLKSAREKLSSNKYPEEEVSKLGGIDIPFSGANLTGKGIGRFVPTREIDEFQAHAVMRQWVFRRHFGE